MQFGIKLPNLSPLASRHSLLHTARKAEACGFAAVWASDHVVFARETVHDEPDRRFPVSFDTPAVDPLTTLAAVAGATERVRLGTSVLVLAIRNPLVTAKTLSSLDLVAPGRVVAGIGTGWQEEEFAALGAADRFRRRGSATEEFIDILRSCWTREQPRYDGVYYSFGPVHFHPQPETPIPVLLGASSNRGIDRVSRTGDGFHGTNLTPDDARRMIAVISDRAEQHGRDPAELEFTTLCELDPAASASGDPIHLVGSTDEIVTRASEFAAAGMHHLALRVRALSGSTVQGVSNELSLARGLDTIEWFADEVVPHIPSSPSADFGLA